MENGLVVWKGRSLLAPHKPIVLILTGLTNPTRNPKNGPMVQSWVLVQKDHPVDALNTGSDRSICGDCPFRKQEDGSRGCYTNPMSFSSVWRAWKAGNYRDVTPLEAARALRGRRLRLGSYGDPCAVPLAVWQTLVRVVGAGNHSGYTSQWRKADRRFARILMASTRSPQETREAEARGYRAYEAVDTEVHPVRTGSVLCPHYSRGIQCFNCGLCAGTTSKAKSIYAPIHGAGVGAAREALVAIRLKEVRDAA